MAPTQWNGGEQAIEDRRRRVDTEGLTPEERICRQVARRALATIPRTEAPYPHCDQAVLHHPGACEYCDLFPEQQAVRLLQGVNFTGQYLPGLLPCPSERRRTLPRIERWPGNRPSPAQCAQPPLF